MQFNQGLRNALLTLFTLKGLIQSNLSKENIDLMTSEIVKQITVYGDGYLFKEKTTGVDIKLTDLTVAKVDDLVADYVKYLVVYPISISGALENERRTMSGKLEWKIKIKGKEFELDSGMLMIIGKYRSGKTTLLNNTEIQVKKGSVWSTVNKQLLYLNEPDHQSALFNVDLINSHIVINKNTAAGNSADYRMTTIDSLSSAENFVEGTLKKGGINTGLLVLVDELNYHGHDWPLIALANWDIPLSEIHGRCPNTLFISYEGDEERSGYLYRRSTNQSINFKITK